MIIFQGIDALQGRLGGLVTIARRNNWPGLLATDPARQDPIRYSDYPNNLDNRDLDMVKMYLEQLHGELQIYRPVYTMDHMHLFFQLLFMLILTRL